MLGREEQIRKYEEHNWLHKKTQFHSSSCCHMLIIFPFKLFYQLSILCLFCTVNLIVIGS